MWVKYVICYEWMKVGCEKRTQNTMYNNIKRSTIEWIGQTRLNALVCALLLLFYIFGYSWNYEGWNDIIELKVTKHAIYLRKFKGTLSIEAMRWKKTRLNIPKTAFFKAIKKTYYNGRQDEFFIQFDWLNQIWSVACREKWLSVTNEIEHILCD